MSSVTIKDIAQIAGVSYSTVSRALSGSPEVSEKTRKRILDICRDKDYHVNALARSLIRSKTNVIGLIVPEVTNPFYAEISLAIETYARSIGYNVMLCNSFHDSRTIDNLFEFLLSHRVDGIIMANSRNESSHFVHKFSSSVPAVLIGPVTAKSGAEINSVSIDNLIGGRMAADYLVSLGHKNILYFGHRPDSNAHRLRLRGFKEVMKQEGLTLTVLENPYGSSSITHGHKLSRQLFSEPMKHTAIFAATDSMALGALQGAEDFNVNIPEDISLLGFDNILYSSLPKITLSTIDQRKQLLAESAVDLLISIIENPRTEEYTHRMIKPALVARNSCRQL